MKTVQIDIRKLKGYVPHGSRDALAEALGVQPVQVSRKLHGSARLTLEDLNTIARFLKQDATDFLLITEEES